MIDGKKKSGDFRKSRFIEIDIKKWTRIDVDDGWWIRVALYSAVERLRIKILMIESHPLILLSFHYTRTNESIKVKNLIACDDRYAATGGKKPDTGETFWGGNLKAGDPNLLLVPRPRLRSNGEDSITSFGSRLDDSTLLPWLGLLLFILLPLLKFSNGRGKLVLALAPRNLRAAAS